MVELALQVLLVVLLLLTITWCVIVHYRLRRLRTDRGELEAFITALGEATGRAEEAVRQMRDANNAIESTAREQERRARQQGDDLARLVDNAVRVIKRLDGAVELGATRVAELRTLWPAATGLGSSPKPTLRQPLAPAGPDPTETPRAWAATVSPDQSAARRSSAPVRPVRREGQLDGLLHGELLEALQGLR